MRSHPTRLGVALAALALGLSAAPAAAAPEAPDASGAPLIVPTPQDLTVTGDAFDLPGAVRVVTADDTDAAALDELTGALTESGVANVKVLSPDDPLRGRGPLTVHLGGPDMAQQAGIDEPTAAEGYVLLSEKVRGPGEIVIAGSDGAGQFYGVQSLEQLIADGSVDQVEIADSPAMRLRGAIEGFYGGPWTHDERLDQLDFYGDVKANTYIYAPKDDPYHRELWAEPYPDEELARLGELVDRADANHVQFTFALSPGNSICYSSAEHRAALVAKLQSVYDLGARSFSIPLDDISYTRWNCEADAEAYGPAGREAAAQAQVDLLNWVQSDFIGPHEGARPLQFVPTEYGDVQETSYKAVIRESLDSEVEVMWTGTAVVPPSVTIEDASAIADIYDRKVFLWDNYPVNDFGNTAGRLLLAPYDKREAGLSDHLSGIVSNPMNQPYASKVAVTGVADFTWNDAAYDAERTWHWALRYLAAGDEGAAEALAVFADLNRLAPTFGAQPWQEQSPALEARTEQFWATWDGGDPDEALAQMSGYAERIAESPETIRGGAVEDGFVTDTSDWLDATDLWGDALVAGLDSVELRLAGDDAAADERLAASQALAAEAGSVVHSPSRNSWGEAPVRIGDGVLDVFLDEIWTLQENLILLSAPERVVISDDGSVTLPITVSNRFAVGAEELALDLTVSDGGQAVPARVEVGELAVGSSTTTEVTLDWPGAPAARLAEVDATAAWSADGTDRTAQSSLAVRASCVAEPTTPVAVHAVSSEETVGEDGAAANAIDGDPGSFWHTEWFSAEPAHPHDLQLDLGRSGTVCGLTHQPRSDSANGRIADYEVYVSSDGETWGEPVATGTLENTAEPSWIPFAATEGRYVRLVATSEVNGNPWTTVAEVSIDLK